MSNNTDINKLIMNNINYNDHKINKKNDTFIKYYKEEENTPRIINNRQSAKNKSDKKEDNDNQRELYKK